MNIQNKINKLLIALGHKNKLYKINSFRHWSDISKKYVTNYYLYKREKISRLDIETNMQIDEYKYIKVDTQGSQLEILLYLAKEYKEE